MSNTLSNTRRKFVLADYSFEYRIGKGWYFGRQLDNANLYQRPYSSLASVTLMIARKLRREVERREKFRESVQQHNMAAK